VVKPSGIAQLGRIDLTTETPISLKDAARHPLLKRDGRAVHISAIYRWIGQGIDGVKLETFRRPSGVATTREAIERFIRRLSGAPEAQAPSARRQQIASANRQLEEAGI